MILQMWSCDADGNIRQDDENEEIEVSSEAEATSKLVEDLYHTASDDFMHKALAAWFLNAEIIRLKVGPGIYWNVILWK